ncbi:hypothetical protein GCM10028806_43740 [Spirosoma terrae]|uniref:Uncharacterized protein n=1 Tax=Spirosoma terrae TaxID=1968276 RepID=A0A6L9L0X6_9BACT|nr:hypothetical protein [Spirosoma terrae]NDU93960.1 hypothetical protein [Spirosoma terrae]
MADAARRFIQLQSFVEIEYQGEKITITLLNEQGQPIREAPLTLPYTAFADKQVFTTVINNKPVHFINVMLEIDDAEYKKLKEQTHSIANWSITNVRTLMADKNPISRPPKVMRASVVREWEMNERDSLDIVGYVAPLA